MTDHRPSPHPLGPTRCLAGVILAIGLSATAAASNDACTQPTATSTASTLHLTETATTRLTPSELVAGVTALNTAANPVAAQRRVNELMAQAVRQAAAAPSVRTEFRDYSVAFAPDRAPRWIAQQTLELRGTDSEALLDLVGRLQTLGLVLGGLDWQLSDETVQRARASTTLSALRELRSQAAAAADALGLEVDRLQDVRIGPAARPIPILGRAREAGAVAAAMPPPISTPESQMITVEVSASVVLRPARDGGAR